MNSDPVIPRVFRPGQVPPDLGATILTIGMFDGVHRGHQAVLGQVARMAAGQGVPAGAVTFDRHPVEVLRPGSQPPLLTSLRHKLLLLGAAGMDFVMVLPFTRALSQRSAEDFAEGLLYGDLGARGIVVGENFRFGHKAAGDVALLTSLGAPRGATVTGIDLARSGGDAVSSTRIRELLTAGDVAEAATLLGQPHSPTAGALNGQGATSRSAVGSRRDSGQPGATRRPYAIQGRVVRGAGRGGPTLGMPTANLRVPERLLIPAKGIYAGHLTVGPPGAGGPHLPAAVSIGVNPTFSGTSLQVEAHVLDASPDLYGRRVTVTVEHRIRDEERFDGVDELVAQMQADVKEVRRLVGPHER